MSHQIESMFYNAETGPGAVPWHGLGVPLNAPPTSREAIVAAGLDWEVQKRTIQTTDGIIIPDQFANIRTSDNKPLGIVGKVYKIVQNREAFDFTDFLLGEGAVYETAGSLFGGEKIWLLAKLPAEKILGDEVVPYLCFVNSHDGKGAIKVATTPVRVVCNNTLNVGLARAARMFCTKHTGDVKAKLAAAQTALQLSATYMASLRDEAEALASKKISAEKFNEIATVLLMPEEGSAMVLERAKTRIDLLRGRFAAQDLENLKGTAWGVLNAVSDFVTHEAPLRKSKKYNDTLMEGAIDGYTILDEAYTLLAAA